MAKCSKNPAINGEHMSELNSHGYWICAYGCGYKKKAAQAQQRNVVQYKGGVFNAKADRKNADNSSRKNEKGAVQSGGTCMLGIFMIPFVLPKAIMNAMMASLTLRCACGRKVSALQYTWTKVRTKGMPRCAVCTARLALAEKLKGN